MRDKNYLYFLFVLAITLSSCFSTSKVTNYNYQKDVNPVRAEMTVFNESANESMLMVKIYSKELLYAQTSSGLASKVKISYKLFKSMESTEIMDSASKYISDVQIDNENPDLISRIKFKAAKGNKYLLEVSIHDLNKKTVTKSYINIDKQHQNSRNNFMAQDVQYSQPLFRNYIKQNEQIVLKSNLASKQKTVFVHFYQREFPLPTPPFSFYSPKPFNYKPDSTFTLNLSDSGTVNLAITKEGFYHFQNDTTNKDGYTLFKFAEDFPLMTDPKSMIQCLRFITTRSEYDELMLDANKKAALDNFWLRLCGSRDRAKLMLKTYYGRAQTANDYFTSYTEGWKTDRGLLYLIFGPATTIYKTSNSETWIYGEENSFRSLNFTFIKVLNPFTDNDYTLNRSELYKEDWYRVVDSWREGRILNEIK